jgi:hypothetical protein
MHYAECLYAECIMLSVFRLSIMGPLLGLRPDSLKSNETGLKLNYQPLILALLHLVEAPMHRMSPFQLNNIR